MKKFGFTLLFMIFQCGQAMEPCPEALLASLTLDQKIAQLFMLAVVSDEEMNRGFMANSPYRMDRTYVQSMIEKYHVGGIVFLGTGTPDTVASSVERLQAASATPLLVAIDAEWGLSMRLKETLPFPRAMTLGALAPKHDKLIRTLGYLIGISCKERGIDMNLAPVADVNNNPKNPIIGARSFAEEPLRVARKAGEFARGLAHAGVLACAKHFPGHGDTETDSHHSLPTIWRDRAHLNQTELLPFKALIAQNIPAIMTGHLHVPALDEEPTSMSHEVVTKLLKNELGFEGLIITDGLGMGALQKGYKKRVIEVNALLAGNDILLGVRDVPLALNRIKRAIKDERISEKEIDQRVLKVLKAKALQPHHAYTEEPPSPATLKKTLYFSAITLVKNSERVLPLKLNSTVSLRVIGTELPTKFTETMARYIFNDEDASTIILAIYPVSRAAMIEEWAHLNEDGEELSLNDFIWGKKAEEKTVITVLFGSPYTCAQVSQSDGILCAYEDDEDAQYGAALTLLGFFNPSGTLPISASDEFPAGTGLGYQPRSEPLASSGRTGNFNKQFPS